LPHEERMTVHQDRYVPADTNAGWGFGAFIIALAIACIVTATIVHKKTYLHPTNPTWHGIGSGDNATPPGEGTLGH
jgi:hypothetical protein